jgi:cytochrome c oxidase subunit 3
MRFLVASLSMLFGATIMGYVVVRSRAAAWPPPGVPSLPAGLLLSTGILVASSAAIWVAEDGIRRGRQTALRGGLLVALALGAAFLVSQSLCWFFLVARNFTMKTNLYGFLFYLLTGLHALHVVGGLIPLGVTTTRAWQGRYTAAAHEGVAHVALYWHFLDAIWLVLFAVLTLTS